jgi:hypothetical protein
MTMLEEIARARAAGDFSALVASVPYLAFLGVRLERREGR